jgi:hypothetical protein
LYISLNLRADIHHTRDNHILSKDIHPHSRDIRHRSRGIPNRNRDIHHHSRDIHHINRYISTKTGIKRISPLSDIYHHPIISTGISTTPLSTVTNVTIATIILAPQHLSTTSENGQVCMSAITITYISTI